eukprot:11202690-Lingulodinium_polyedra.AAC.1
MVLIFQDPGVQLLGLGDHEVGQVSGEAHIAQGRQVGQLVAALLQDCEEAQLGVGDIVVEGLCRPSDHCGILTVLGVDRTAQGKDQPGGLLEPTKAHGCASCEQRVA